MKTLLESYCDAMNWQGGTIHQVIESLPRSSFCNSTAYSWGYREGKRREHGICLAYYPVPVNSWNKEDARTMLPSYVRGLYDGLSA